MRVLFDGFTLDAATRELLRGSEVVHLSPKAFQLLLLLVEEKPKALAKRELHERLWPATYVSDTSLAGLVAELRAALNDDAKEPRFVRTVYGFGYSFCAETTDAAEVERERGEEPRAAAGADGSHPPLAPVILNSPARTTLVSAGLISVLALLLGATVVTTVRREPPAETAQPSPPIRTIAILPFETIGPSTDNYLGLGLADRLITRLGNVRAISVRPTSAVRKYAGGRRDSLVAGRELKVDAVLEGSIRRSGQRMRVNVQLVSLHRGTPYWAETFDEKATELLALEDAISGRVAMALTRKLSPEEQRGLLKRHTNDLEAHRLYVQGRYHYYRKTTEDWKKALQSFEEAARLDPKFAAAYAGVADTYCRLGEGLMPPMEARAKARAAAWKALELDPSLPEAHLALGEGFMYDWNWPAADREFSRAVALRSGGGEGIDPFIRYLLAKGRVDEALDEGKRALEMNPASPILNADYGYQLYLARRYSEAIVQLRRTVALDPHFAPGHARLGLAYIQAGQYDAAISEFKIARQLDDSPQRWGRLAGLGYAYGRAGRSEEAREVLRELEDLSKTRHVVPYNFVLVFLGLGDHDRAFEFLEKSYAGRHADMLGLKTNPAMDPLRSDARFIDLVRRVGIPD